MLHRGLGDVMRLRVLEAFPGVEWRRRFALSAIKLLQLIGQSIHRPEKLSNEIQ